MAISGTRRRIRWAAAALVSSLVVVTAIAPATAAARWELLDLSAVTDSEGLAPSKSCCSFGGDIDGHGDHVASAWGDVRANDPFGTPDSDIEFRASHDGGSTWGPLLNLSRADGKHVARAPKIAVGPEATIVTYNIEAIPRTQVKRVDHAGNVTSIDVPSDITWVQSIEHSGNGTYRLLTPQGIATYIDGATSLDPTGEPHPFPRNWYMMTMAAEGGVIVLEGSPESNTTDTEASVAVSTDGGRTFSKLLELTDTPQREFTVNVEIHDETIVASWFTQFSETDSRLYVARSTDNGTTWSTPAVIVTGESAFQTDLSETTTGFALTTPGAQGGVITSSDGLTWTTSTTAPKPLPYDGELVTTANGSLLLGNSPRVHHLFNDSRAPQIDLIVTPPKLTRDPFKAPLSFSVVDTDSHSLHMSCVLNGRDISVPDLCYQQGQDNGDFEFHSPQMPVSNTPKTVDLGAARYTRPNVNTLRITATDEAGNTSDAIYTWTIDITAPRVVSTSLPARVQRTRIPWTVTATDAPAGVKSTQVRIKVGTGGWRTPRAWVNLAAKSTINVPLARATTTQVSARAIDRAGNIGAWTNPRTVNRP